MKVLYKKSCLQCLYTDCRCIQYSVRLSGIGTDVFLLKRQTVQTEKSNKFHEYILQEYDYIIYIMLKQKFKIILKKSYFNDTECCVGQILKKN